MMGTVLSFRFADFEIDLARQELRRAGANVHIEPQVFDLLVHLIRNRDRIVSKDELFAVIWQGRIVSEATLNSRISAARRALGDSGSDQSFIRTLHKRGFRFVGGVDDNTSAPTAVVVEKGSFGAVENAADVVPTSESPPLSDGPSDAAGGNAISRDARQADTAPAEKETASSGRRAARKPLLAAGVMGLAALGVGAAWWLMSPFPPPTPHTKDHVALASEAPSSAERLRAPAPSIVILPFAKLSGDAQTDYLADGITEIGRAHV